MKKTAAALILFLLLSCLPQSAFADSGSERTAPFYGVWFGASKDRAGMQKEADTLCARGFNAKVVLTTDWSELNPEPWYVATAGFYDTRSAAEAALPWVQNYYPDAYVKYSGNRQGPVSVQSGSAQPESSASGGSYETDGIFAGFYGIWCGASKSFGEAQGFAYQMQQQGFPAAVFLTTDWSNLNPEPWYVISAGSWPTQQSAEEALSRIQAAYPDAYIKYSGSYQGARG